MNRQSHITPLEAIEAPPPCATWFLTSKPFVFNSVSGTKRSVPRVPLAYFLRLFKTKWHQMAQGWHTFCCATYVILFKQFTYKK